jgi:Uma2 family endonuclease
VDVGRENKLRPDLAVVMEANGKLWLAVEVIQSGDHQADTVLKKALYEDVRLPRLWMVDPRYDNVEVYHASPYGLMLKGILAAGDTLTDPLLGGFSLSVGKLFSA